MAAGYTLSTKPSRTRGHAALSPIIGAVRIAGTLALISDGRGLRIHSRRRCLAGDMRGTRGGVAAVVLGMSAAKGSSELSASRAVYLLMVRAQRGVSAHVRGMTLKAFGARRMNSASIWRNQY